MPNVAIKMESQIFIVWINFDLFHFQSGFKGIEALSSMLILYLKLGANQRLLKVGVRKTSQEFQSVFEEQA